MNLTKVLKGIPHLSLISKISRQKNITVWLVGGFLRDIYLKRKKEPVDFDFCVEDKVLSLVKEFARQTSSKFIALDEAFGNYRVIVKTGGRALSYDFSLMRGDDFFQDLLRRDFSINTLAVNISGKSRVLGDKLGAALDLDRKVIRVVAGDSFRDDPLRILRGFSFMVNYGFRVERRTLELMAEARGLVGDVSGERVGEELFKVLRSPVSFSAIKIMEKSFILDEVIPHIAKARNVTQEGGYHHLDVLAHSLEALRQFEFIYRRRVCRRKDFREYLDNDLAQNRKLFQIIKLACLLHDIGKPAAKENKNGKTIFYGHEKIGREMAEDVAERLRLSFKEKEVLKKLIFWHMRPGFLADQEKPTPRAVYRFFRDTGEEGVAVILLSLADWRATRGPKTDGKKRKRHERIMLALAQGYFDARKTKPVVKLVDGYDIMKKFNLRPSKLVGTILARIKEEQAVGKVRTKQEAYRLAAKMVKRTKDEGRWKKNEGRKNSRQ